MPSPIKQEYPSETNMSMSMSNHDANELSLTVFDSSCTLLVMPMAVILVPLNGCLRWTTVPVVSTIGFRL